jgi:hypothetical protein
MTPDQLSPNSRKVLQIAVELTTDGSIPPEFDIVWGNNGGAFNVPEGGFLSPETVKISPLHLDALP